VPDEIDPAESTDDYHLAGPSASGRGRPEDGGFVVRAGARARATEAPSTHEATRQLRLELLGDGALERDGDGFVLTRDYRFSSPSQAAAVLLGRVANGWIEWKDGEGRTMSDTTRGTRSTEAEFRRQWYEAHAGWFESNPDQVEDAKGYQGGFDASAEEALVLRDALARTGDVTAFHEGMKRWAVRPGTLAFNGFSGQMFINQLVNRSEDHGTLARILADALALPRDDADAAAKTQALVDYVETIRVGAHPAPGHSNFLLSYFWGLEDHARWPVLWSSAAAYLEFSSGEPLPPTPPERYVRYLALIRELDADHDRVERVASWWEQTKPVLLDPVLTARCAYGLNPGAVEPEGLAANAAALVSAARHIGTQLVDEVSAAVGRSLAAKKPPKLWKDERPRSDLWADWSVRENWGGLGLRLWVNQNGAAIGLRPGWVRDGWFDEAAAVIDEFDLPGFRLLSAPWSKYGDDVGFVGGMRGEFVYARWFDADQLAELDVRAETTAVAAAVQPLLDKLVQAASGEEPPPEDDPLAPMVQWFRESRGYPRPADEQHKAQREAFAALLAPDAIALADPAELRRIWNGGKYGSTGPHAALNVSLRDADAAEYDRIIDTLSFICWGEGEDSDRIDEILSDSDRTVRGLGETVILKLLAICHPDRYLPVFPYSGPKGKRRMLQLLGLPEPTAETRGQLQVQANDLIRERLDRFFPGDPWGMAQFLYRYAEREDEPEVPPGEDPLDVLADELLLDRGFLDDLVSLLEDKGQVILYGPPGTGKTYLARKLAEVLVPDPTRRSLVQFHPSTSYEDFFEGYRPEASVEGEMTYRLTPGPLALLATRAADAPGKRHIMVIDEINRANLPKVLGELLYLFEYRDEQVRTLYRPDDPFELPKDVWFIGTMNTADRSIALIDAALRRRFHFVPVFPNQGPMAGLLDRWLRAKDEPGWVGELVAMVNDELVDALGGPHLQLGPSHFMKAGLDEDTLRRIWQYNIEPFIEDQFFGDPAQIDYFRFGTVMHRYQSESGLGELAELADTEAPVDGPVAAPASSASPESPSSSAASTPASPAALRPDETA
jgi:5-methylcytosine-specific restriction enzyme B